MTISTGIGLAVVCNYRIHTEPRVFTRYKKPRQKTEAQPRFFVKVFYKSRKHEGEVCILFKSMLIKIDFSARCKRTHAHMLAPFFHVCQGGK